MLEGGEALEVGRDAGEPVVVQDELLEVGQICPDVGWYVFQEVIVHYELL